jgi:hypothetical protein
MGCRSPVVVSSASSTSSSRSTAGDQPVGVDNGLPWKSRRQSFSDLTTMSVDVGTRRQAVSTVAESHADHLASLGQVGGSAKPPGLLGTEVEAAVLQKRRTQPKRRRSRASARMVMARTGLIPGSVCNRTKSGCAASRRTTSASSCSDAHRAPDILRAPHETSASRPTSALRGARRCGPRCRRSRPASVPRRLCVPSPVHSLPPQRPLSYTGGPPLDRA